MKQTFLTSLAALAGASVMAQVPSTGQGEGLGTSTTVEPIKISIDVTRQTYGEPVTRPLMSVPELKGGDLIQIRGPIGPGASDSVGWQVMVVFTPADGVGAARLYPPDTGNLYKFPVRLSEQTPQVKALWEVRVPSDMVKPIATFILVPEWGGKAHDGVRNIVSKTNNWQQYLGALGKVQRSHRDILWTLDFLGKTLDPSATPAGTDTEQRIWTAFSNAGLSLKKSDFNFRITDVVAIQKVADGLKDFLNTGKLDQLGVAAGSTILQMWLGPWAPIAKIVVAFARDVFAREQTTYAVQMAVCQAQAIVDQNLALHLTQPITRDKRDRSLIVFSPLTTQDINLVAEFKSKAVRIQGGLTLMQGEAQAVAVSTLADKSGTRYVPRGVDTYWNLRARKQGQGIEQEVSLGTAELQADGRFIVDFNDEAFTAFPGETKLNAILYASIGFEKDFPTVAFPLYRVAKTQWTVKGHQLFVARQQASLTLVPNEPTAVSSVVLQGDGIQQGTIERKGSELEVKFNLENVGPGEKTIMIAYPGVEETVSLKVEALKPVEKPHIRARLRSKQLTVVPSTDVAHIHVGGHKFVRADGDLFRGPVEVGPNPNVSVSYDDDIPVPRTTVYAANDAKLEVLPALEATVKECSILPPASSYKRESNRIAGRTDRMELKFGGVPADHNIEIASGTSKDALGVPVVFSPEALVSSAKLTIDVEGNARLTLSCSKLEKTGALMYRVVDRKNNDMSEWMQIVVPDVGPVYMWELPEELVLKDEANGELFLEGKKLNLLAAVGATPEGKTEILSTENGRLRIDRKAIDGSVIYIWLKDQDDLPIKCRLRVEPGKQP